MAQRRSGDRIGTQQAGQQAGQRAGQRAGLAPVLEDERVALAAIGVGHGTAKAQ